MNDPHLVERARMPAGVAVHQVEQRLRTQARQPVIVVNTFHERSHVPFLFQETIQLAVVSALQVVLETTAVVHEPPLALSFLRRGGSRKLPEQATPPMADVFALTCGRMETWCIFKAVPRWSARGSAQSFGEAEGHTCLRISARGLNWRSRPFWV